MERLAGKMLAHPVGGSNPPASEATRRARRSRRCDGPSVGCYELGFLWDLVMR